MLKQCSEIHGLIARLSEKGDVQMEFNTKVLETMQTLSAHVVALEAVVATTADPVDVAKAENWLSKRQSEAQAISEGAISAQAHMFEHARQSIAALAEKD